MSQISGELYTSYLLKESNNKSFESLQYEGFDTAELKKLFRESNVNNLFKVTTYVSLTKAPYLMSDYAKTHKLDNPYSTLVHMLKSKQYIVHHLFDSRSLRKIAIAFALLTETPFREFDSLDNYLIDM